MDPVRIRARYREAGQRMTVQRQAVASVLAGDRTHPSARQVLERVRSRFPTIAPGTVYRILDELVAMGELRAVEGEGGGRRYDPNLAPHAHLLCRSCGTLEDVSLEDLSVEVAPAFAAAREVHSARVMVHGLCANCSASAAPSDGPSGRPACAAARDAEGGRGLSETTFAGKSESRPAFPPDPEGGAR